MQETITVYTAMPCSWHQTILISEYKAARKVNDASAAGMAQLGDVMDYALKRSISLDFTPPFRLR